MTRQSTPRGSGLAFIERAVTYEGDDCLLWPFGMKDRKSPYGRVRVTVNGQPKHQYAHRIVLERTQGPPPTQWHDAAHAPVVCHNPSCVNPRHLRWATRRENAADRWLDGTISHLTRDDIEWIRLYESRVKRKTMAAMFNVSTGQIRAIQRGACFKQVTINGQVTVQGQRWKPVDEGTSSREWLPLQRRSGHQR